MTAERSRQTTVARLRTLLRKYMRHVEECEGVTFISDAHRTTALRHMTEEEWDQLCEIQDKAIRAGHL